MSKLLTDVNFFYEIGLMKKKELSVNWEGPAVEGKTIVVGVVKLLSVVSVYVCVVFVRVCVREKIMKLHRQNNCLCIFF